MDHDQPYHNNVSDGVAQTSTQDDETSACSSNTSMRIVSHWDLALDRFYAIKVIMDHCEANAMGPEECQGRTVMVDQLGQTICNSSEFRIHFPHGNVGFFVIGSTITGLGLKSSIRDLDICMMLSFEKRSRGEALDILRTIKKIMRSCNRFSNLEVISAIVPILIFKDDELGIDCDLNINNFVGIRNSHLLRCYTNFDWRVKPLVLFIKKWARVQDINSARHKTICSYALTLMVINYLQCGVGSIPILPCLQQQYPLYFTADFNLLNTDCIPLHHVHVPHPNPMSPVDLLLGFLEFYAHHFKFEDGVVSVRCGRVLTVAEVQRDRAYNAQGSDNSYDTNAQMYVEEPFNMTNVARSVYDSNTFKRIKQVFKRSYEMLKITGDPNCIINNGV